MCDVCGGKGWFMVCGGGCNREGKHIKEESVNDHP